MMDEKKAPTDSSVAPYCCFLSPTEAVEFRSATPGPERLALGCQRPAEWEIICGDGPDDYTHSCTDHVGSLLTDAEAFFVYPLK